MYKVKDRTRKREIQERFYDVKMHCDVLILAGPDPAYSYELAEKVAFTEKKKHRIVSYETDEKIHAQQLKYLQMYKSHSKWYFAYKGQVKNAKAQPFCDIDLMCTMKKGYKTFTKLLREQLGNCIHGTYKKCCFIGTVSLRGCTKDATILAIQVMIDSILRRWKYKLEIETYSDKEGPMLTFRITY